MFYSTHPSIHHPSICPTICPTPPLLSTPTHLTVLPSTYLFTYPSMHLLYRNLSTSSIHYPFIHQYIPSSTHLLIIYLLTHLSINSLSTPSTDSPRDPLFIHPPTQLLPIYHLFIYYLSSHLSIHHPSAYSFIHLLPYFHSSDQSSDLPISPYPSTHSFHQLCVCQALCARLTVEAWKQNRQQTVNVHCDEVSARGGSMVWHSGPGLRASLSHSVPQSATY